MTLNFVFSILISTGFASGVCPGAPNSVSALQCKLEKLIMADNEPSDGSLLSIRCVPKGKGIFCHTRLEFIEIGSPQTGEPGGNYECDESYSYYGGSQYSTECSTCWFTAGTEIHHASCK